MIINNSKDTVVNLLDRYSKVCDDFAVYKKLFPNAESILIESLDEYRTIAPEIQNLGDDVTFVEEWLPIQRKERTSMKGTLGKTISNEDTIHILYATVFKFFEDEQIPVWAEPFIPLCSWTGYSFYNLMFMNYADIISQYFTNKDVIINKCDEHLLEKFFKFCVIPKHMLTYLPSRLRKLINFT